MPDKTVSVVLATYNGSRYLEEQLSSLARQTRPPLEIVISDDGSTDDTAAQVRRFQRNCSIEVRFFEQAERLGFRDNFLQASLKARGDFIAFCDQDDLWRHDKIERCAVYFGDPRISMIVHPAVTIDSRSQRMGTFSQGIAGTRVRPPLSYDPWSTFWGFSIVFRRDLLAVSPVESRFIDYIAPAHRVAHDRWVSFLAQIVGATVELDEQLASYRQHEANVFGQGSPRKLLVGGDLLGRSKIYAEAASRMLQIVDAMPATVAERFPLYDRRKSLAFVERSLAQVRAREAIYAAATRTSAWRQFGKALVHGHYRGANDGKIRWQSLARDLQFLSTGL